MYYSDTPINLLEDDKLSRKNFVRQLTKAIVDNKTSESLVIGLYGSWGSGKSSVLNIVQDELKKEQVTVGITFFDPWFFNSYENLVISFFSQFCKLGSVLLNNCFDILLLKILIWSYTNSLNFSNSFSVGSGLIGLNAQFNGQKHPSSNPKVKKIIEKIILKMQGKIVIFIDNLDRLDVDELLLMFKLVRLCSDFPNTVYILAFDNKQVKELLKGVKNIDVDFLEKIIQIDISLPEIDQEKIGDFFIRSIEEIFSEKDISLDKDFYNRFNPVYNKLLINDMGNFRCAKKFLNALTFSLDLVKNEIDYTDFLLIEYLRVFYSTIYSLIYSNKVYLVNMGISSKIINFHNDDERTKYFIEFQKIIHDFYPAEANMLDEIVGTLFPEYYSFLINPRKPNFVGSNYYEEYSIMMRITSPNHFEKYFQFQVPHCEISNIYLNTFITRLNTKEDNLNNSSIVNMILEMKKQNKLQQFFSELRRRVNLLYSFGTLRLIDSISNTCNMFTWPDDNDNLISEITTAEYLLLDLFNSIDKPNKFSSTFSKFISECKSITFACDFSYFFHSASHNGKTKFSDDLLSEYNNATMVKRINKELIDPEIDFFRKFSDKRKVIFRILNSRDFYKEHITVEKYIYGLIKRTPENITSLLNFYYDFEKDSIDINRLETDFNKNKLYLIIKNNNFANLKNQDSYLIDQFINQINKNQGIKL